MDKKIQPAKVKAVEALNQSFEGVKDYIFTNYRGLTVEQITNLRVQLRKENAEYKVVKNNFAKIAFHNQKNEGLESYLVGPTAVALCRSDSGPVAKLLLDFAKDTPVEVKGGFVGGSVFNAAQVEAFSKLPSRLELIQILMGTMKAPLQNLVYVLNGVTTKLVRTLQAVVDKKAAE